MIKDHESTIMQALQKDLGKPETEAYIGEIQFLYDEIKHAVKHLKQWMKPRKVGTPLVLQARSEIRYEPLGTVLVISPWNYPFQLLIAPLAAAMSAGNTAIIKPSELAPALSKVVADIIPKYFADEYVGVVEGGIPETTELLDMPFDHIFYTGSTPVGKIVMAAAAKNLTPVTLELGGKSPCIVDQNSDLRVAARRIAWGKFYNAGQTCVAPDYILAHASIKDEFINQLKAQIKEFYGDNPQSSPDYARIINERHFDRLTGLLDQDKVAVGGDSDRSDKYIAPTVVDNVSADDKVMEDEIFGPILPVLTWNNLQEAIDFVNERPKPLALYVFSRNKKLQESVIGSTSFGGGCVNEVITHLGNPDLPFGGVGASGMGAYHGRDSFEVFSHRKSLLKRGFWMDVKLRYPPYTIPLQTMKKLLGNM